MDNTEIKKARERVTMMCYQILQKHLINGESYYINDIAKESGIPEATLYKCVNQLQTMSLENYLKLEELYKNVFNTYNNKKHEQRK